MPTLNELDNSASKLVKEYQKSYKYILNRLEYQINHELNVRQSVVILEQIQAELRSLDKQAYKWSQEVLPEYYKLALSSVNTSAGLLSGVNVLSDVITQGNLSMLHKQAIKVAAESLYEDLAKNTEYMSQQVKKIIRDNAKEILNRSIISGESHKKTKKDLTEALRDNGVTSFVDAGKKEWQIDKYASMAVRSKSRIIHNQGTMNRLEEYRQAYPSNPNFDTVQISRHFSKCWCGYYEGMVFSLSGQSDIYPALSTLPNFNLGYMNFHPNCKHVLKPYMPDLNGKGKTVSSQYLNKSIKDMNKLHYDKNKV